MDLSAILTTLWSKISKPLPNVLVGLVIVFLAPKNIQWAGYVFLAIGLASFIEWICFKALKYKNERDVLTKVKGLSNEERNLLNKLRINSGISFDSNRTNAKEFQLLQTLEAKGLTTVHAYKTYRSSGYAFRCPNEVQLAIKNLLEEDMKDKS